MDTTNSQTSQFIYPSNYTLPNIELGAVKGPYVRVNSWDEIEMEEKITKRNFKIFIHFTKLFTERFVNWSVEFNPADPFGDIKISTAKGKCIKRALPYNEVQVRGVKDSRQLGLDHFVLPNEQFYAVALGIEDPPAWVTETDNG